MNIRNFNNDELIERYLAGELAADQMERFEERLFNDAELLREFSFRQDVRRVAKDEGRELFAEFIGKEKRRRRAWGPWILEYVVDIFSKPGMRWSAAAVSIFLVIGGMWLFESEWRATYNPIAQTPSEKTNKAFKEYESGETEDRNRPDNTGVKFSEAESAEDVRDKDLTDHSEQRNLDISGNDAGADMHDFAQLDNDVADNSTPSGSEGMSAAPPPVEQDAIAFATEENVPLTETDGQLSDYFSARSKRTEFDFSATVPTMQIDTPSIALRDTIQDPIATVVEKTATDSMTFGQAYAPSVVEKASVSAISGDDDLASPLMPRSGDSGAPEREAAAEAEEESVQVITARKKAQRSSVDSPTHLSQSRLLSEAELDRSAVIWPRQGDTLASDELRFEWRLTYGQAAEQKSRLFLLYDANGAEIHRTDIHKESYNFSDSLQRSLPPGKYTWRVQAGSAILVSGEFFYKGRR